MAAAWQQAPAVDDNQRAPRQADQPAWMAAPAVDAGSNQPLEAWQRVTAQPSFQEAGQEEREQEQLRFYQENIAPSVPAGQARQARSAFFEATMSDVEVPRPGLLRRTADAAGNLAGAVGDRLRPAEPAFDANAWREVERSEAFQQSDLSGRHALRRQFFEEQVAPGLEGEERREAERALHNATDLRGSVEGSRWQPDGQEREPVGGGLLGAPGQTTEEVQSARRPNESTNEARPSVGEFAKATPALVSEQLIRSGAGFVEGLGLMAERSKQITADNQVTIRANNLGDSLRRLEEAESFDDYRDRDQIIENLHEEVAEREKQLNQSIADLAEREPSQAAELLRGMGLDLQGVADRIAPGEEFDGLYRELMGGLGSMLLYYGPGLVTSALTRGSAGAALAVSGSMAGPSGVSEQYNRAIAAGLSEEEAVDRSIGGFPGGVVQVAPVAALVRPLPAEIQGRAIGQLYGILRAGGSEFVAENAGAIMQNLVEQSYNEERGTWDNTPYQGLIAGGSSMILQTAIQLGTRGRGMAAGPQGRLGRAMQEEADGVQFVDDTDAVARALLDPENAQYQQVPADPAWEQSWRDHERQNDLDPINLQQGTGITATVSPGEEAEGQESTGLVGGAMRQDTPAQAEAAEEAEVAQLLRAPADPATPEIARAQESLAMGDGFAFLSQRAAGDEAATEALGKMQEAYLQGDGEGAAVAYQEAMQTIRTNERQASQQDRKQAAIEGARQQAAAEGGDALTQAIAGEEAEAQANQLNAQEDAADPIVRPTGLPAGSAGGTRLQAWPYPMQQQTESGQPGFGPGDVGAGQVDAQQLPAGGSQAPAPRLDARTAETGQPIRATGYRVNDIDPGTLYRGAQVPVLGRGAYVAPTPEDARAFARDEDAQVAEREISLENPLVIRSDEQWRELTREAGWATPNPSGRSQAETEQQVAALEKVVKDRGHDGVAVLWDDSTMYDMDEQGRGIKNLRNVFSKPQVVAFGEPQAAGAEGSTGSQPAGQASSDGLIRRVNDQPFATSQSARASGQFRDNPGAEIVPDGNGFAIRPQGAEAADTTADTQTGRLPGRTETTYLPDNTPLETQFRVMDAGQVQASNLPDGRANPNYDPALQPRDRGGQSSQVQVRNIAANLNPERLGASPDAGSGAPIIGPDGMVESGNGRFMAIQTAYQQGRGDAYRDFVRQQAIDAGMDPAAVDAMEAPVLVRERLTEIDRADLGRRANDASAARMSPVETALADAERISVDDLTLWQPDQSGDPLAASNRDFQRRFAQRIGENEAAGLRNPRTGRFTAQMGQRMTAAVMGRAYRGADGRAATDVVELSAEQSDQMRNLQAGLQAGAVDLALAYETGDAAAMETVHAIVDAIRIVRRARDEGISINELVAQVDAFDGEVSPLARDMAVMINTNMRSRRALVEAFRYIGEQARANADTQTGSMFDDAPAPTPQEITRAGFNQQTEDPAQDGVAGEPASQDGDAGRSGQGAGEPAAGREAQGTQGAAQAEGVGADTLGEQPPAESLQNEAESDAESLTLETQTEESLAAREQETRQAEQAQADQRREQEQRAQADRDADDFVLSGSDTAADQAMSRGQDSLFRLSPSPEVASRRDAIAEAVSQHPELADVQTVARVGELPAPVQVDMLRKGIDPSQVRGVFYGGRLFVVAENLSSVADGVKYAVHEAVGHKGVREVLGSRLDAEMQRLYRTFPQTHEVWQTVKANYPHIDPSTREGRQEFAEELAAHLSEGNPQVSGWQAFVARVRDLLRQVFPEVAWTEADVRALIQRGRETLAEQALADGTVVAGSPRFSIAPPTESQAFRDWFGDSKVVDEGGQPKVLYHGTLSDFSAFDTNRINDRFSYSLGLHFTDSTSEASQYASGFDQSDGAGANIVPVYLQAENPLIIDTTQPAASMEADLNRDEINRQRMEAIERGDPYDAVIIRRNKGDEYDHMNVIVFRPEQVKSAFNQGTFDPANPDIRFSLEEGAEVNQPRLSAIHNISAEGLAYADRMGGLAVPSIGVVTEQAGGVDGFGEITLIGRRELADPAREAVFSADAYTVRFPRAEYNGYRQADFSAIRQQVEPYAERFDDNMIVGLISEHGMDSPDARQLMSRATHSDAMMGMFLDQQGQSVEPVVEPARIEVEGVDTPAFREYLEGKTKPELRDDWPGLSRALREAAHDKIRREFTESGLADMVSEEVSQWDQRFWDSERGQIYIGRETPIFRSIDAIGSSRVKTIETRQRLEEAMNGREAEYKTWLEDLLIPALGEPRIKVGRRKLPYTLENIVEAMTRERAIAGREQTMTFGAGQVRAANAEQFQTLERMREAAAQQVRNPAEYEAARAETEALLDEYRTKVSDYTTVRDFRGRPDTWEGLDGSMRVLARYLGYKRRGKAAFERALKAEEFDAAAIRDSAGDDAAMLRGQKEVESLEQDLAKWQERQQKLPADDPRQDQIAAQIARFEERIARRRAEIDGEGQDLIALGMQAAEALEQTPVPYFEAKPQRAVELGEFAGAVIPEGAPATVREILDRQGIPYREAPGDQRAQAVHDFRAELDQGGEDVLFSLGEQPGERPTATQVRDSLQGIEGLGRPEVLDSSNQLDLDTGLKLTLRGVDPQSVVAFHDDAGRLRVIAGNALSADAAINAAVVERVRQNGLKQVIGDRINAVTNRAYEALTNETQGGNRDARQVLRNVRATYSYLDPSLPADRAALMLEVAERLNARGTPPGFVTEMRDQVSRLLSETHGVTDASDLGLANRAYLTKMQRDFGGKAPPEYQFGLDLQAAPGYGTLTEMGANLVDAAGRPIDDMKIPGVKTLNPIASAGRAFVLSQTDRLRASGNEVLVELGNRTDRAYDQEDARLGRVMTTLRPALLKMEEGSRQQRKQNKRDFEQYWRDRENGRKEQAREVYERNPAVAAMVDASAEMFFDTGTENQAVKTPTRTGIWVHDGEKYRVIGRNRKGEHWPRVMRQEVSEVIRDPSADLALWDELVSAVVDARMAKDKQEAGAWLRDHQAKQYSAESSNDFVAAMERARGEQLPEIFYDYSLEVVTDYASSWAKRISQIEAFGQVLKPGDKTAFDEAVAMTSDPKTKEYVGRLQRIVFNTQDVGPGGRFMRNTNVLATGLHLTNWATASQNLVTGSGMNASMFGGRRMMRAYFELMRDYKAIRQEGLELGILGKDTLNLIRDAERNGIGSTGDTNRSGRFAKLMEDVAGKRMSAAEALREFTRFGMKWGGYTATEQMIRANAMVAAKLQLTDALKAWNSQPGSAKAGKYRRFMRQNRIDIDALVRENGKGEETARYLRLMVNIPQGSYRADMVPQIVDTEVGRWVGKYQKFGTQTSRMFWQQKMKPMMEAFADPNASAQERAMAFMDTLNFAGWGMASGLANRSVRAALFGMAFVGADLDEIWDRFTDGEFLLAASLLMDNLWHNAMSAGYIFGVFSTPLQAVKDYRDRARMRNPFEPPALAIFEESVNLLTKFAQQDYQLTGTDMLDSVMRTYGFPRVAIRAAATAADAASPVIDLNIDRLDADMVRRDVSYIRGATRRWADQTGVEARMSGSFTPGSTPNTPGNNKVHRAVSLGNGAQASQLVADELRGLQGDEYRKRLTSLRSSLNARHPLRVGGKKMNQDETEQFMRWARQSLPPSRLETIETRVRDYERAMDAAMYRR